MHTVGRGVYPMHTVGRKVHPMVMRGLSLGTPRGYERFTLGTPRRYGRYPLVYAGCSMVGIHPCVYAPLLHPGYTHHPTMPGAVLYT